VMRGVTAMRVARTFSVVMVVGCAVAAERPDALVARNAYGKVTLSFEPNHGQTDARVKFLTRASGYTLFVTPDEAVFAGRDGSVERMKLIGTSPKLRFEPLDQQPGISNYFIGNDPSKWQTNVPHYGRVALRGVYSGIDLIFYSKERRLEYDWVVAPGADPKQIRVKWEGLNHLMKNASGDLVLTGSLVQKRPVILQEGKRIEGGYVVRGRRVAFELAKYDTTKPLLIDPAFIYSTYLGGSAFDDGSGIGVDGAGNAYVTGRADSIDFPTSNPLQASNRAQTSTFAGSSAFVTKINTEGSALVYSTYLGGSLNTFGFGIAVDGAGNAYVTGTTYSSDFPTINPLQASNRASGGTLGGSNAFVTKINTEGSALLYSTYLGGSGNLGDSSGPSNGGDWGYGIAVDGTGNAYVTGTTGSTDFPTSNPLQASNRDGVKFGSNAFVTKINASGSAFVYSTYLGGSGGDSGRGIAADSAGNAYVTGMTYSTDFPTSNPLQATNRAVYNAFVTKINAAGSAFVYATYLGGSGGDSGYGIAVDGTGNAYVTGGTASTDFPTSNPLQTSYGGESDAFVSKINAAGSALVYSTYLGGSGGDGGSGIAVDGTGNAYVTGATGSTDFPTSDPLQASNRTGVANGTNAFVSKINAAGSALVYSTYVGGAGSINPIDLGGIHDIGSAIAVDGVGNAYVTGETGSTDFPTSNPLQASLGGTGDAFVLSISPFSPPFAAGGEVFLVSGGSGSLNFTFPADVAWTATSSASWLTLTGSTSGNGNGTLTYLVDANLGGDRSATITVGGFSFTIEQEASPSILGLSFIGSMPHLAAEENWTTTFTLVNNSAAPGTARLSLFGDPNGTLTLPLTFPQASQSLLAPSLDRTLSANASLIIKTAGPQIPPVQVGSAQLSATGAVDGFAIFHHVITQQETVVPMETRNASSYLLAFDNTGGVLGVAVANVSAQAGNVGVVIRDDSGPLT
jgi:hypothetical protein